MTLPTLQFGIMGESGAGKSHFIAGLPKPLWVAHLDPTGKAQPYVDRGVLGQETIGEFGQRVWPIYSRKNADRLIIQIEFFQEPEPTRPCAYDMLFKRSLQLHDEVIEGRWASAALETMTALELAARFRRKYGRLSDPEKSNIFLTDDVEEMVARFGGFPCNVAIAAHIDERPASFNPDRVSAPDKKGNRAMIGGQLLATAKGPGRMQKGFSANFASEMYRLYTYTDDEGNIQRALQTQNDGKYACATRIGAPDGCEASYPALFVNWAAKQTSNGTGGDTNA